MRCNKTIARIATDRSIAAVPLGHVTGVVVSIPEELETGFLATLPEFLADAYGAEE